jgi:hypothetical protein
MQPCLVANRGWETVNEARLDAPKLARLSLTVGRGKASENYDSNEH